MALDQHETSAVSAFKNGFVRFIFEIIINDCIQLWVSQAWVSRANIVKGHAHVLLRLLDSPMKDSLVQDCLFSSPPWEKP